MTASVLNTSSASRRTVIQIGLALILSATSLHGEAYVAGYIGGAVTQAADVLLSQPRARNQIMLMDVPFRGKSFQSPIYYGYRAGYYFRKHFGLEAEFIHVKAYADLNRTVEVDGMLDGTAVRERAPISRYVEQFEVSHGLNMVLVNAVARRAVLGSDKPADARLTLVGRAGIGPTIPRPEVTVFGVSGGEYQSGPVATQIAAGVEAKLWRGLRLITEYKYTFTPASFDIPDGRASFHAHSHHVVTGFAVHF